MAINYTNADNGTMGKFWAALVTILATLCIAMFVNWAAGSSSAAPRAEVNAAIADVKRDVTEKDRMLSEKLDRLQQDVDEMSIRVEHIDTLLEGRKAKRND